MANRNMQNAEEAAEGDRRKDSKAEEASEAKKPPTNPMDLARGLRKFFGVINDYREKKGGSDY